MNSTRTISLLGLAATLFAGCWGETIDSTYGYRQGLHGSSVNGTGVLGDLFEQAGHRVSSRQRLTPGMQERTDVIVWFPHDFEPPSEEVFDWLDLWLYEQDGRTLIIVGRDHDAAPSYWRAVQAGMPAGQAKGAAAELQDADLEFTAERAGISSDDDYFWYQQDGKLQHRDVRSLAGKAEWLAGIDPARLEIELHGRVTAPEEPPNDDYLPAVVLLESEGDALVFRQRMEGSQVIVVANGSFLLNLPLVNHEHRKLAAQLIREVGDDRSVVFLESGGNPSIAAEEEPFAMPTGLELLGIAPFNQILLHLALVGIIFCFVRWPVFGRPREESSTSTSDFGEHVMALGALLALTENREYARQRLSQYQQTRSEHRGETAKR